MMETHFSIDVFSHHIKLDIDQIVFLQKLNIGVIKSVGNDAYPKTIFGNVKGSQADAV